MRSTWQGVLGLGPSNVWNKTRGHTLSTPTGLGGGFLYCLIMFNGVTILPTYPINKWIHTFRLFDTNDSSELRKVKRLRPHPFWGTSKSKLYFFSNIFSKKHTYVTRIASIRCVQICWGQQANLELPSEGLGDRMSIFKIAFMKRAIKQQFFNCEASRLHPKLFCLNA